MYILESILNNLNYIKSLKFQKFCMMFETLTSTALQLMYILVFICI